MKTKHANRAIPQRPDATSRRPRRRAALPVAFSLALTAAGCAVLGEPAGTPRKETVYAVTDANRLVRFNAGQPRQLDLDLPLQGLQPGETLVGIDFRVARGMLYGLGTSGRLYVIDTTNASVRTIGNAPLAPALVESDAGFDFNPTVDRIRVVGAAGRNLRLHPDTGAVIDGDPALPGVQLDGALVYANSDANAGKPASIQAAAYTYNKVDEKVTTNFAIDTRQGLLVTQGSRETARVPVSPNSGRLFTVGPLKVGPIGRVSFDIADVDNTALIAVTAPGAGSAVLHLVNLDNASTTRLGTIGGGGIRGIAIEP
ncbi:MAG TPA: DUF4394 domain-containing protein [Quisquiliibacterium sp.]|nr:DUF4394 domain-containing protein [Quisquiliibacterium sp.]HQP65507.1 DUF4394 domain-containing protein [Quisquiliibacterium sp.]